MESFENNIQSEGLSYRFSHYKNNKIKNMAKNDTASYFTFSKLSGSLFFFFQ